MFYEIKNSRLAEWGDYKFSDNCKEIDGITMGEYNLHPNKYVIEGSVLVLNPNYEQEEAEKEAERINNFTMTPLDFIKVLENFGLTLEQINVFLENNLEIKMQLTYCNSVYCGVVKQFLPLTISGITITSQMVEQAFKLKNGVE